MRSFKTLLALLLFFSLNLYGVGDADFDGVDDSEDKCPNTPFSDLIDSSGCTTSTLYSPIGYDFIIGYSHATSNANILKNRATTSTTLQADIYRGNISMQIHSSYYKADDSNDKGWNDTQLLFFYAMKPTASLKVQVGGGLILPTYSTGYHNEATDYIATLSLEYTLSKEMVVFGGYSYTAVNDKDIDRVAKYKDTQGFYTGISYAWSKNISLQMSYSKTQSIYIGVSPIETLACGILFPFDAHWFTLLNYQYGLNESDHETAMRLGYRF